MHKNTPNHNPNIHFWPLGSLGGALGGTKWFLGWSGGFFGSESVGFFLNVLYWSSTKFWGVTMSNFDFTHLSMHAEL